MDDFNFNKMVNQLQQVSSLSKELNRAPTTPIPSVVLTSAQTTTTTNTIPPTSPTVTTVRPEGYRVPRRTLQPQFLHQYNTAGTSLTGAPSYGGAFNNYPFNRHFMNNMSMGGNYNHFNTYGQPMITPRYQNPTINAAAESSRPAFESIWSVVQSFNAVSMMLETSLAAMQTSFQALLSVAENVAHLKMFMMKLYSTIVSFKLARWFLLQLFNLLKMVRGVKSTEENVWTAIDRIDTNQVIPYDGPSWPIVLFGGLLAATPYFIYKLLNSVTPLPESIPLSINNRNGPVKSILFKSLKDWSCENPETIPLVKGENYFASTARLADCEQNRSKWLLVDDTNGRSGYVPYKMLEAKHFCVSTKSQPVTPDLTSVTSNVVPSTIEQIQPQPISPVIDVYGNPIDLPHTLLIDGTLKEDVK